MKPKIALDAVAADIARADRKLSVEAPSSGMRQWTAGGLLVKRPSSRSGCGVSPLAINRPVATEKNRKNWSHHNRPTLRPSKILAKHLEVSVVLLGVRTT